MTRVQAISTLRPLAFGAKPSLRNDPLHPGHIHLNSREIQTLLSHHLPEHDKHLPLLQMNWPIYSHLYASQSRFRQLIQDYAQKDAVAAQDTGYEAVMINAALSAHAQKSKITLKAQDQDRLGQNMLHCMKAHVAIHQRQNAIASVSG